MPTLELIREFVEFARRNQLGVPVAEISSRFDKAKPRTLATTALLARNIRGTDERGKPLKGIPQGGHLLFITHETYYRMAAWPYAPSIWGRSPRRLSMAARSGRSKPPTRRSSLTSL